MRVLLISTYELGHQPFGLASPAAWLREAGAEVDLLDLAVEAFDTEKVRAASLIAFHLPMHTATRLAAALMARVRRINREAHLCCYGLYAPLNEAYLRSLGVGTILGGEFESGLLALYRRLAAGGPVEAEQREPSIAMTRQQFLRPDRRDLPALDQYASVQMPGGRQKTTGYTEASRGCKHRCGHCPIVPVYNGRFRIVQRDVVLEDIRQQVRAGAEHITFGDPDFFNGPGHAIPLVQALHEAFPDLTYDVTIKIEHLLQHRRHLPTLRETGCLFVTSAVEAVDDDILGVLDKGHNCADFIAAVELLRDLGLPLNPTFLPFTPWIDLEGYLDLLALIDELGLVEHVAPIQYAIRLLIPAGSKLLALPSVAGLVDSFDPEALAYPWSHPDPAVDELYEAVFRLVKRHSRVEESRQELFEKIWDVAEAMAANAAIHRSRQLSGRSQEVTTKPIPHLNEDWY